MSKTISKKVFNWLLVVSFILIICAPSIEMISSKKQIFSPTEKRILASLPDSPKSLLQIQSYFSRMDTYLNDHFGYRDQLIYRYQRELRKYFDITAGQSNVHKGLNDWYFYNQPEMMLDFTGKTRLSRNELRTWENRYYRKRKWLNQRGIKYLLVAVPNKQTIYPEFMMENWKTIHTPGKLAQLIKARPEIAGNGLLDLSSTITKEKMSDHLMYYKSGTHWTAFGAYTAYLEIAKRIERLLPELSFEKGFTFTEPITKKCAPNLKPVCGDLTQMLLDFEPFEESFKRRIPYNFCAKEIPLSYSLTNLPKEKDKPSLVKSCLKKEVKAVVFRDSFFIALEPYFSENFSQVIYLWKQYDKKNMEEILKSFEPDIVIEEIVERNFF